MAYLHSNDAMDIKPFSPRHPLLSRYIEYYYFLKTTSSDFSSAYYAFPNTLNSLNIHRSARCEINSHEVTVHGTPSATPLMILQGRYVQPLRVQLNGLIDKITIVFKPLGLNPFLTCSFAEAAPAASQAFTDWINEDGFEQFLHAFYQTDKEEERIAKLETYLVSRYRAQAAEATLQRAIALLTDFDNERPIAAIAEILSMNARSFHRLFRKNIGLPPVAFRKVARFRHSMKNKLFSQQFRTLTAIGYQSNFTDQSYFTKMYKKLTGENPKKIFSTIEQLAESKLIFKFMKE